jgi:hypothetical protein
MTTTSKTVKPFGEWLHGYRGRDLVIADLRDDFRRSCRDQGLTAADFRTAAAVRADMVAGGACREALDALRDAVTAYQAKRA